MTKTALLKSDPIRRFIDVASALHGLDPSHLRLALFFLTVPLLPHRLASAYITDEQPGRRLLFTGARASEMITLTRTADRLLKPGTGTPAHLLGLGSGGFAVAASALGYALRELDASDSLTVTTLLNVGMCAHIVFDVTGGCEGIASVDDLVALAGFLI